MRSALLLALPLVLSLSACSYDNGDARRVSDYTLSPSASACDTSQTPAQSAIDADRQIEVDAGQGAGVFVEYSSGGHWIVSTSCDTLRTSTSCAWDIIVTPQDGSSLSNVTATDLESADSLSAYDAASYRLRATTSTDLDGFSFDSDPGAAVRVDAFLDGACAVQYFYWVGDGALHSGSPTNPIDLVPSAN